MARTAAVASMSIDFLTKASTGTEA